MKKPLFLTIIGLVLLLFLSACTNKSANKFNETETVGKNSLEKTEDFRSSGPRMPDFGQPDKMPDVRGLVRSIVGNEVTILKVEGKPNEQGSSTPEKSGKEPSISLAIGGPGRDMGGRAGSGEPGRPGEEDSNSRADRLAALKEMSVGEEKIIIPVGIQMLKPTADSNGKREMVEATLADISIDKTLTIWLNSTSTDQKLAEFVLIN